MPLAGEQLTYGWALAVCYYANWRGADLRLAVAVMSAESARYILAYHENYHDGIEEPVSTDWGLFQINDKAHPTFELPEMYRNPLMNAKYAHKLWKAAGGSFSPWAAYDSGAFQKFMPLVHAAWLMPNWKVKVGKVERRYL